MLEQVKKEIGKGKERMVPLSTRVEDSTRMFLQAYAAANNVKLTELTRYILNAFLDDAKNETMSVQLLHEAGFIVPFRDENGVIQMNDNPPFSEITLGDYSEILKPLFAAGALTADMPEKKD